MESYPEGMGLRRLTCRLNCSDLISGTVASNILHRCITPNLLDAFQEYTLHLIKQDIFAKFAILSEFLDR